MAELRIEVPALLGDDEMAARLEITSRNKNDVNGHIVGDELMLAELRALGYSKFCDLYESLGRWFE